MGFRSVIGAGRRRKPFHTRWSGSNLPHQGLKSLRLEGVHFLMYKNHRPEAGGAIFRNFLEHFDEASWGIDFRDLFLVPTTPVMKESI